MQVAESSASIAAAGSTVGHAQAAARANPSSAADLARHIADSRVVTVTDADGSEWTFSIRRLSARAWDVDGKLMERLHGGKSDEAIADLGRVAAAPPEAVMRHVLLHGVESPAVSEDGRAGTVGVERLLARDVLAIALYAQIAQLSFSELLKLKVAGHGPATS